MSIKSIQKQEEDLRKQLKAGKISQAKFDLRQGELLGKAQGLGLAKEKEFASKGIERKFGKANAGGFKVDASNAGQIGSTLLSLGGVGGQGETSTLGGAASGATGAMATAASFGMVDPVSQGVAAVVGGTMGALGARYERKAQARAAQARAEAQKASNPGRIEQEKDAKIQGAFSRLSQAFASNLRGKKKVTL